MLPSIQTLLDFSILVLEKKDQHFSLEDISTSFLLVEQAYVLPGSIVEKINKMVMPKMPSISPRKETFILVCS